MKRGALEALGLDLRSLALFRVLFGATLFIDTLAGARDLGLYFTDDGVLPREAAARLVEASVGVSAHFLSGSLAAAAALSALTAAAALAFTLGVATRAASIALFALTLSAQIRDPLILQGSDSIARVVLFWSMFLPLGARASVDALRAREDEPAGDAGRADDRRGAQAPPAEAVVTPAAAGFVLQIALIYWASAALKTDEAWRTSGTAVYYVLNVPSIATPLGRLVGAHPDLCRALTLGTLALEVAGPALLFLPFARGAPRLAAAALFIGFHVALHLCMRLGPFSFIAASAWTALLPPIAWDFISHRSKRMAALGRRWRDVAGRFRTHTQGRSPTRGATTISSITKTIRPYIRGGSHALAAAATFVVVWLNAPTFFGPRLRPPRALARASLAVGLNQEWGMFAPGPPRGDVWLVFEGRGEGGRSFDALRPPAAIDWDRPAPSPLPRSQGENYVTGVIDPSYEGVRPSLARWICRRVNEGRGAGGPPPEVMRELRIYVVIDEVPLPGAPKPPKTSSVLWEGPCP